VGIKEEVETMKEEIKEHSFAMELMKEQKINNERLAVANKRMFGITLLLIIALTCLSIYTINLLNDIGVVEETTETTQDIKDIDTINGNVINNGDVNG